MRLLHQRPSYMRYLQVIKEHICRIGIAEIFTSITAFYSDNDLKVIKINLLHIPIYIAREINNAARGASDPYKILLDSKVIVFFIEQLSDFVRIFWKTLATLQCTQCGRVENFLLNEILGIKNIFFLIHQRQRCKLCKTKAALLRLCCYFNCLLLLHLIALLLRLFLTARL